MKFWLYGNYSCRWTVIGNKLSHTKSKWLCRNQIKILKENQECINLCEHAHWFGLGSNLRCDSEAILIWILKKICYLKTIFDLPLVPQEALSIAAWAGRTSPNLGHSSVDWAGGWLLNWLDDVRAGRVRTYSYAGGCDWLSVVYNKNRYTCVTSCFNLLITLKLSPFYS